MLTKEECEQALDHFEKCYWDQDNSYSAMNGVRKYLDILNELINEHFEIIDKLKRGELSDGYHTFNELYHHRAVLFSIIVNQNRNIAWKSKKHHDGTMYDGMFIVGIDTPQGQYSYHYDIEPYWNMFECKELDNAPVWDGHDPKDIDRLKSIDKNPPLEWEELKECNVVYDKEQKKYRLIEDLLESGKRIVFTNTIDSFITENYESNRFYRKEVKE